MTSQTRAVNNVTLGGWTDPDKAFVDDDQCTYTNTDMFSNRYNFINNPFNIPDGATIDGLKFRYRRGGDGDDRIYISLIDALGGSYLKIDTPPIATCVNALLASGGGPTDLWGGTWTSSHINSANFAAGIMYYKSGKASLMYVDYIEVTVYYTYIPPETGILSVDTTPVKGEVFVEEESWGTAPQSRELTIGFYTISFGEIAGYTTPDPVEAEVIADQTTYVDEVYVEAWYCTLNATIEATEETCVERGFDWGIESGNYTEEWTEEGSYGVGSFSRQIMDLDIDETYYFRGKARNAGGWGYGGEKSVFYSVAGGFKKLIFTTEPPTGGQFNKLSYDVEPQVPGAWNKLKREA